MPATTTVWQWLLPVLGVVVLGTVCILALRERRWHADRARRSRWATWLDQPRGSDDGDDDVSS